MNRRQFVRYGSAITAALALPERLLADPYAPLLVPRRPLWPVRVEGA